MFGIRINFRDGSRPLVVTACPDAESARAMVFNANRDPNVDRCDILSADMLPTTTSADAAVRDYETGALI
jgi:hypothetical protein